MRGRETMHLEFWKQRAEQRQFREYSKKEKEMRLVDSEITRVGGRNDGNKGSQRFVIYPPWTWILCHAWNQCKCVNPEEIEIVASWWWVSDSCGPDSCVHQWTCL